VRHGNTGDTGDYASEEVAQMAHSLAVKAITNPQPCAAVSVGKLSASRFTRTDLDLCKFAVNWACPASGRATVATCGSRTHPDQRGV
jgi:hypothetical protein